ncbi:hypothetical protein [Streptomyces anulatus]|uniref:hypothetical protein n=1 Tax=Streptomyces anulatus TaxID=1892 RepID=UPI0036DEBACF
MKPNGRLGSLYMLGIKPFRYLGVYPALLRSIGREWQETRSVGQRPEAFLPPPRQLRTAPVHQHRGRRREEDELRQGARDQLVPPGLGGVRRVHVGREHRDQQEGEQPGGRGGRPARQQGQGRHDLGDAGHRDQQAGGRQVRRHHGDEFVAHADEVGSPGQQEHDRQSAAQRGGQPSEAVDPARSDDQRDAGGADESDERFHGAGIPSGSGWWVRTRRRVGWAGTASSACGWAGADALSGGMGRHRFVRVRVGGCGRAVGWDGPAPPRPRAGGRVRTRQGRGSLLPSADRRTVS